MEMEKIEVTMEISESSLEKLSEALLEDFDKKIETAIEDYDLDEKMNYWFEYNADIASQVSDALSDINFKDYIDTDEIDIESSVRDLMNSFSPINSCSTGKAAMDVIQDTIRYLLLKDEDFVSDIAKALTKHETKELVQQERLKAIEEVTPILRSQFQLELSQYSEAIEADKARQEAYAITRPNGISYPLDLV